MMLQYVKTKDITHRSDGTVVARVEQLEIPPKTPESQIKLFAWGAIGEEFLMISEMNLLYEKIVYK